jgi:hypothetical protein
LWVNSLTAIGLPPPSTQFVDVMYRGADIFRVMQESISQDHDFIIRSSYNRKLMIERKKLLDFIRDTNSMGTVRLSVKKNKQQKRNSAKLKVARKKLQYVHLILPKTARQ